jgi:hypothetical protein
MDTENTATKLLKLIKKNKVDIIILFISVLILVGLLYCAINKVNESLENKEREVITRIEILIHDLNASSIPSINSKMALLGVAAPELLHLGAPISLWAVILLILAYLDWLIFKKAYTRLENACFKLIDNRKC